MLLAQLVQSCKSLHFPPVKSIILWTIYYVKYFWVFFSFLFIYIAIIIIIYINFKFIIQTANV